MNDSILPNKMRRVLAISGSLRAASSNSILIRAIAALAPENVEFTIYNGLADLPHFNPDLDIEGLTAPAAVAELRNLLKAADAVLISSPEYAHGVPGSLKNALDWVVSSGETVDKPFALINASPRSIHAHAQLVETLTTMAATIVAEASITIFSQIKNLDEAVIIADTEISGALRSSIAALVQAI